MSEEACKHEFEAIEVEVINDPITPAYWQLIVSVKCTTCDKPFKFLGLPIGSDPEGATIDCLGTEVRLGMAAPEQSVRFAPTVGLRRVPGETVPKDLTNVGTNG